MCDDICDICDIYDYSIRFDGHECYECKLCGQDFRDKYNLKRHIQKNINDDIKCCTRQDISDRLKRVNNCFQCYFCGKFYTRKNNTIDHILDRCKQKKKYISSILNGNKIDKKKIKQKKYKPKKKQIKKEDDSSNQIISLLKQILDKPQIQINAENMIYDCNFNYNSFSNPDLSYLSADEIINNCIGKFTKGDSKLLEMIYFNKKYPNNQNIKLVDKRNMIVEVIENDKDDNPVVIRRQFERIFPDLCDRILDIYNTFQPKIDKTITKRKRGLKKDMDSHLNRLSDASDVKYRNKLKREIKHLLMDSLKADEMNRKFNKTLDNIYSNFTMTPHDND